VIESGLLIDGLVIPNTSWIQRDSSAWYTTGDDDVYRRAAPARLITYHWTAGPRRTGATAAQRTYKAMQARRKANGEEMSVSAQFVISDDGLLFQLADLKLCCVHADVLFNRGGIGVEYTYPGTVANAEEIKSPVGAVEIRSVAGRKVECLLPSSAALATAVRFSELLVSLKNPRLAVQRVAYTQRERMTRTQMAKASGVLEHYHAESTTKVDAAGFFVDAHAAAGWPAGK
jgi:hypothetical protein